MTLIVPRNRADEAEQSYTGVFRMITLQAHSSLETVGLTAAVADKLTQHGISANVIAAYHHDHVFVPALRANDAVAALEHIDRSP